MRRISDPAEELIRRTLTASGISFIEERQNQANLDFYLEDFDVYIEVKQFHSDRIARQMARAPNVIAVQGMDSVRLLAKMIYAWSTTNVRERD